MNIRLRHLVLLLPLALAGTAVAQTDTPAAQYSEEIEVRVIDVDVVVTDRKGNRLTNLTREDFELYEDGKRVDIGYFSRTVGGRIDDMPAPPPTQADEVVATAQQPAAVAPRIPLTWVIFIDHTNLSPQSRNRAMRALQKFARGAITRGDRGVIALNNGRSFRIRHGVTDDPKLLMETLAKIEKERVPMSPTKSQANQVLNIMRRSEADFGNVAGIDQTRFMAMTTGEQIQQIIDEEAARTRAAVAAMNALLDALARVSGRLALVHVGAGFNTLPGADLAATWRARYGSLNFDEGGIRSEPRPEDQVEPIERDITKLYNNLSALRVTVYSIYGGDSGGGPTTPEDSGTTDTMVMNSTDIGQLMEAGNSRELAQRTGGLYFKVNPGLANQLDDVVRDLDDYYSLGYKPTGRPGDARRIKVKVNVDGARVRHRETVRERTPNEKAAGAVVASMVQPQPKVIQKVASTSQPVLPAAVADAANPLGVSVRVERPTRHGWDHLLPFNFSINLEALTFAKHPTGLRAEFVMHFALVGADGSVYPLESREQSLGVPSSEAPKQGNYVSYAWHANVGPLHVPQEIPVGEKGMRLTVTVEDRSSGRRSVVTVPLGKYETTQG